MKTASRPSKPPPEKTPAPPSQPPSSPTVETATAPLVARHLRAGWWSLLLFLTMGLILEALHGFKVGGYLRVDNETRRLMWTLAHAHGTLLGLVNLAFASALGFLPGWPESGKRLASAMLLTATLLMPAGFFLGGLFIYSGDPGLGILLVPVGGFALFTSVFLTACALRHFQSF